MSILSLFFGIFSRARGKETEYDRISKMPINERSRREQAILEMEGDIRYEKETFERDVFYMNDMEKVISADQKEQHKNEIVTNILTVLAGEQVTISEAISIIEAAKDRILKTRIDLLHNH